MLSNVLSRFPDARQRGNHWHARCPAHDDRRPSLTLSPGRDGRVLIKCHAGCELPNVLRAAGLASEDIGPERRSRRDVLSTFAYTDEHGHTLYEVVRYAPKDFRQRRPDGAGGWSWRLDDVRRVPYRLHELKGRADVFIVEGEKDADRLWALGAPATTNAGGAGKWSDSYSADLRGAGCRTAIVLPDNDEPGARHASEVVASLRGAGIDAHVVALPGVPPKGDVSDWLDGGGTLDELRSLAASGCHAPTVETSRAPNADVARQDDDGLPPEPPGPVCGPEAFIGPIADFVGAVDPHTEADPVAVLVQALAAFGNIIGRTAHVSVGEALHFGNLFVVVVGETSKGRKGTSWTYAKASFANVDASWTCRHGLVSGEGLTFAVRDARPDGDAGVSDKRLLVVEEELAKVLQAMSRQGNTLSPVIRSAWDSGDLGTLNTNHRGVTATGAHLSVIAHITRDELRRCLTATEAGNGFANRFLWVAAHRSKLLPEGGSPRPDDLAPIKRSLAQAVDHARRTGCIRRDAAASALWATEYGRLSAERPGLVGSVTSRAEAQTIRLALLYALSEGAQTIEVRHLRAALTLWRYCFESARWAFGDALGDRTADQLRAALRARGAEGMTRDQISNDLFSRNRPSDAIDGALRTLKRLGLARGVREQGERGRPAFRWFSTETD